MMWSLILAASTAHAAEYVSVDAACGTVTVVGGAARTDIVRNPVPREHRVGGLPCVDLQVRVPHEVMVSVTSISASLVVTDFAGEVRFKSLDGGLRVTEEGSAPSRINAETASGAVEVRVGAGGELRAETVSGAVAVSGGPAKRINVSTVSGSVTVKAELLPDAWVFASTHSAPITTTLDRAPSEVTVDNFSGTVHEQTAAAAPSGEGPRVEVETFSGAVRVQSIK
ncbi:MAG: hypothetical protein KTR31_21510 [Myxococcales bacterium]|nr:hypothetical protein [Myxococcales bacterium]